jgi:hypothetical protein
MSIRIAATPSAWLTLMREVRPVSAPSRPWTTGQLTLPIGQEPTPSLAQTKGRGATRTPAAVPLIFEQLRLAQVYLRTATDRTPRSEQTSARANRGRLFRRCTERPSRRYRTILIFVIAGAATDICFSSTPTFEGRFPETHLRPADGTDGVLTPSTRTGRLGGLRAGGDAAFGGHRQLVASRQLHSRRRQAIVRIYRQPTLQISAQIWNF